MEEEDTFVKNEYQIHIKDCANRVMHKLMLSTESSEMKISIDEYHYRLKLAVSCYYESVQLSKNLTETEKNRKQLISTDHPAFDFWLSLHLTTVEPYDIPLILDAYHRGQFGEIDNFIGHVEFFVKRIIQYNIFYPFDSHMKEIVSWIREIRRAEHNANPESQTINVGELKIQINQVNIGQYLEALFDQRSINNQFNSTNIFYNETTVGTNENKEEPTTSKQSINKGTPFLIQTGLDFDKVLNYFMQLNTIVDSNKKKYMEEEDVIHLVLSNFQFKDKVPKEPKKQFVIKLQKQVLIQFIYVFYNEFDMNHYKNKLDHYCQFLIDNFVEFKNSNQKTLKTNMAKEATGLYPFKK
jgi:hypothetical protein